MLLKIWSWTHWSWEAGDSVPSEGKPMEVFLSNQNISCVCFGWLKLCLVCQQDSAWECEQLCDRACSLPCHHRQGFKRCPVIWIFILSDLSLSLSFTNYKWVSCLEDNWTINRRMYHVYVYSSGLQLWRTIYLVLAYFIRKRKTDPSLLILFKVFVLSVINLFVVCKYVNMIWYALFSFFGWDLESHNIIYGWPDGRMDGLELYFSCHPS